MAKIVVLELGFEDDEEAEIFKAAVDRQESWNDLPFADNADVIECRVENP